MIVVKSVTLPLAPAAAFDLFTQRIAEWWPPDRRHTPDPRSEIFLLASGRFYERARDGREVELGLVRAPLFLAPRHDGAVTAFGRSHTPR